MAGGIMSIREAEEQLQELENQDEVTAEDLERFRRSLPTNPEIARALQKALPVPWSEVFEYVEGSERQSAYWRVRPDRSEPRSEAERRFREDFREATKNVMGTRGVRTILVERESGEFEEVRVSPGAVEAARQLNGKRYRGIDTSTGERAMQRLRNLLGL